MQDILCNYCFTIPHFQTFCQIMFTCELHRCSNTPSSIIRMSQMNGKTMVVIEMMKIIAFTPKICRIKQLQMKLGIFSE